MVWEERVEQRWIGKMKMVCEGERGGTEMWFWRRGRDEDVVWN